MEKWHPGMENLMNWGKNGVLYEWIGEKIKQIEIAAKVISKEFKLMLR